MVTGVVFQNFSLSDPTAKDGQVLWPIGLLQPGIQQGTNMPLKLFMQDVEILTDLSTLQGYTNFFQSQNTSVYTVGMFDQMKQNLKPYSMGVGSSGHSRILHSALCIIPAFSQSQSDISQQSQQVTAAAGAKCPPALLTHSWERL